MAPRVTRLFPSQRPGLLALLLGALMLRLLVPAGFMIGADAAGAPTLVLCDGYAPPPPPPAMPMMHAGHHGPQHDPARHHEAPCPYAALTAPVLPPLPPIVAPSAAPAAPLAPAFALAAPVRPGAAAPPPPATGPPLPA